MANEFNRPAGLKRAPRIIPYAPLSPEHGPVSAVNNYIPSHPADFGVERDFAVYTSIPWQSDRFPLNGGFLQEGVIYGSRFVRRAVPDAPYRPTPVLQPYTVTQNAAKSDGSPQVRIGDALAALALPGYAKRGYRGR